MTGLHPSGSDVLRLVLSVGRECFAAQGIPLPDPIADGGGPSSTFTAAVFAGTLLGIPAWGPHVAVRIPDAAYDLDIHRLMGPHLGVFRQVFFSLPVRLVEPRDPEEVTRTLMAAVTRALVGEPDEVLFRAYQWNANSTRMVGEAKEVNLASGLMQGMEICQLNRIEQVGGVKLPEPSYLIVIGVDRLTYALALRDYYLNGADLGRPAEFYGLAPATAQAITRLHHRILFSEAAQPDLLEGLDHSLSRLARELGEGACLTRETMAEFRRINIVLETLFMARAISGDLRQAYIGRIGDLSKLIARSVVAHPEEARALATEAVVRSDEEAVSRVEALLLKGATDAGDLLADAPDGVTPQGAMPQAVVDWHAGHVTKGIQQDLIDRLASAEEAALTDWIRTHYADIGPAVRHDRSGLPVGFAAVRVAEEQGALRRDLAMPAEEVRAHLGAIRLLGGTGMQRQERVGRLFAVLEAKGVELPAALTGVVPYLGVCQAFFSARVFERTIPAIVESWFDLHVPDLKEVHVMLQRHEPPSEAAERHGWGAVKLEIASRYLLLRAAANKPLWQDPYGARHLLNRALLPMWRETGCPEPLRRALIDEAVLGVDVSEEAIETVRQYLIKKLLVAD